MWDDEVEAALRRGGLEVPEDLRAGTAVGYRELLRMVELLRGPRSAMSEPAAVFRVPEGEVG
ncbi:hypothetical protein [Saccharothrix sp. NRRL B-16314]|uniref:hypothetical protein n=1 Tax=Saccharothrix sp. NRRL B-16314 TaxID=1463825 RepID=UPI00052783D0|nr:hypothetical protein [Saccharothrix sp. NRRL B-16314]